MLRVAFQRASDFLLERFVFLFDYKTVFDAYLSDSKDAVDVCDVPFDLSSQTFLGRYVPRFQRSGKSAKQSAPDAGDHMV